MKLLNKDGNAIYFGNLVDDKPVYGQILEHICKWGKRGQIPHSIILMQSEMTLLKKQSGELLYIHGIPIMRMEQTDSGSENKISMEKAKEISHWIQKMDEAYKHLHEAKEKLIELGVKV